MGGYIYIDITDSDVLGGYDCPYKSGMSVHFNTATTSSFNTQGDYNFVVTW